MSDAVGGWLDEHGSGSGAPAWAWKDHDPGTTLSGTITRTAIVDRLDFNKNPIRSVAIELRQDDTDEMLTLWVDPQTALSGALGRARDAAESDTLARGGRLAVTFREWGTPRQEGFNPPRLFDASYVAPVAASSAQPESVDTEGLV